ncbi:MAG: sensor histidine kinase [Eubacteriales bacterium]|nr:sensor histidine kinase [Eubacteriales bacterium]
MNQGKRGWRSFSLKRKFYCLMGSVAGLSFLALLFLCLFVSGLMRETQQVLYDNNVSLAFQASMEEERRTLQLWVEGQSKRTEQELETVCRQTEQAVEELPDVPGEIGMEQAWQTWSIRNAYRVYREKRDELLETDRGSESFAGLLYTVYDMQDYLVQYGSRLVQTVMRQGNQSYLEEKSAFHFVPVLLALAAFVVTVGMHWTSRIMDETFIEPVLMLARDAKRIASNDFSEPLPRPESDDEMGTLVTSFSAMKTATESYISTLKENSELQIQLEKVQLQMLKNQINPHFLFNTLNMISCMAQLEDAEVTDKMILAMSRLFQYALKSSETVTPLENEIRVVQDYLYLQKMRFGDRLNFQIRAGEGTRERMVPSFILQPLVENAIVHGIGDKEEGGTITVESRLEGEKLWITVSDTGAGMTQEALRQLESGRPKIKSGHGIGLGNILRRVHIMYEDGQVLISSTPGKGTKIEIGFTEKEAEEHGAGEDSGS